MASCSTFFSGVSSSSAVRTSRYGSLKSQVCFKLNRMCLKSTRERKDGRSLVNNPGLVMCSMSSLPAGLNDENYVEMLVTQSVAMEPVRDQLYIVTAGGSKYEVSHINPLAGKLLFKCITPTIVLQMAEDENVMLPIIVGESSLNLLIQGIRNESSARPNCYDLMIEMMKTLEHEVCMVRIEQRVADTYFARVYICKNGTSEYGASFSMDARPSDAMNLAVRFKVPIFVHQNIILNDAIQLTTSPAVVPAAAVNARVNNHYSLSANEDLFGEELSLLTKMMTAVEDERYREAAEIRNQLTQLRQGSWKKV